MKELSTIDDLSTITMLSTRTVRNYFTQGFLNSNKIDGIWKLAENTYPLTITFLVISASDASKSRSLERLKTGT